MSYLNIISDAKPTLVRPTQNYLNVPTLKYYLHSGLDVHPPIPVVHDPRDNTHYSAIDGHHQLVLSALMGIAVSLWVVNSPRDIMPYSLVSKNYSHEIDARNQQIKKRIDYAYNFEPIKSDGSVIVTLDDLMDNARVKSTLLSMIAQKSKI